MQEEQCSLIISLRTPILSSYSFKAEPSIHEPSSGDFGEQNIRPPPAQRPTDTDLYGHPLSLSFPSNIILRIFLYVAFMFASFSYVSSLLLKQRAIWHFS